MPKLSNLLNRIEKTAKENGINVPLYYIEKSKYYKQFQDKLQKSIIDQIKGVCTKDNVDRLLMFTKADVPDALITEITASFKILKDYMDVQEFLVRVSTATGQISIDALGVDGTFVMKNKEVLKYFEDHANLLITNVDNTTKEWIASKIQEGKNNFMSPSEIANTIIDDSKTISRVRAEMIVLTETANAVSVTQKEVALRYGIKEQIWRTSIDERVCPICLPLEGRKAEIGKTFPNGYIHPPAHPRCRCFLEDVIPDNYLSYNTPWLGE